MYTSLVQARALYGFFYKKGAGDDFRVGDFSSKWKPPQSRLYQRYMDQGKPAQKRIFHLVRNRSVHPGGTGPEQLNKQVLQFAKELRKLTEALARNADPAFQCEIQSALGRAIREAELSARHYGIPNPF
jgi:hypothetical protein